MLDGVLFDGAFTLELMQSDLDNLYATRDALKLELIQRILVNDFDSEDTNELIRDIVQVQNEIEKN